MYFEPFYSAKRNHGSQTEPILRTLIQRFVGANPKVPYNPVIDFPERFFYDEKGWCHCFIEAEFATLPIGGKVAASTYWSCENDRSGSLVMECYGPTIVYVNGEKLFATQPAQENRRRENTISFPLKKGWNQLTFVTEKTTLGLGFRIRSTAPQWDPVCFYQRSESFLPVLGFDCQEYVTENDLPIAGKSILKLKKEVIASDQVVEYLVKLAVPADELGFCYEGSGELRFIDGEIIRNGQFTATKRNSDWLDLIYRGTQMSRDLEAFHWQSNSVVNWLYCGPVAVSKNLVTDFTALQKNAEGSLIYWQAPYNGAHVRLARNAALYAHWTYWMGVTLYGFLEAGRFFSESNWKEYALASVKQITDYDNYGQWDKAKYHYTLINTQFYWLDELDDCGSFGNLMLESLNYRDNAEALPIAKRIADFMKCRTLRQPDGAFYRSNETMWIDDLYMSTPFLTRYWELTGDTECLDEAVQQFFLFKERFFMADKQLMSHIYDTEYAGANRIPWSRGNGWVVFSLSELLDKLPQDHPKRDDLRVFFNQLIAGILAQQDEVGLWHQVLDDETTYSESSCSAMFICAISRGIRNGYLNESLWEAGRSAVQQAWQGLITYCIDKSGNLYGVCRGSGHSFSRDYYRGLGWLLNDAHGTGIVALAGVEYERLMRTIFEEGVRQADETVEYQENR